MVREAHDLVLERGAVACADALDQAVVHRRFVEVGAHEVGGGRGGPGNAAVEVVFGHLRRDVPDAEMREMLVEAGFRRLDVHAAEVDRAAEHARRRARFEAARLQSEAAADGFRQQVRGGIAGAAPGEMREAVMQETVQKGPRRHDDRLAPVGVAEARDHARDGVAVRDEIDRLLLTDRKVRGLLEHVLHGALVAGLVALCARRPHGGPLRAVQHAELDGGGVGDLSHEAAEGVDLAHEMPLRDAADARIAAHLRDVVQIHGEHQGRRAEPRGCRGGFTGGMTSADHDDVKRVFHRSGSGYKT